MKNKKIPAFAILIVFLISMLAGSNNEIHAADVQRPIIIQGALPIEIENLVKRFGKMKIEKIGTFVFYLGEMNDHKVIVSKTGKGMENAAAATAIAIEKYHPIAIINQGTSGGHVPNLHVFDIVIGKRVANIGSFKTEVRLKNEGIAPTKWIPMNLLASEGSEEEITAENILYFEGDRGLLAAANSVKNRYTKGSVVQGTIGSSDVWNNEVDRIKWLQATFGTSVEEMEAAAAAQISQAYHVPFLGIRILSNNLTNGESYNPDTAAANQEYVYAVVKSYISILSKTK